MKTLRHLSLSLSMLSIALFFLVSGCSQSREDEITILHTNDMHCQYVPMEASWVDKEPRPLIGGMVALEYFVRTERARFPKNLLLDAGDILTGTPLAKIEVNGAFGGGFVEMMNLIGFDATTIGNHEFDDGQENLKKLIALQEADVLSANLLLGGEPAAPKTFEIYRVGELRVGVIGLILEDLAGVVSQKHMDGVRVENPAQAAQEIIDRIDSKTDLIVLLTHEGVEEDRKLASQVRGADIIVGGHSHTRLEQPEKVNGMLIVQAGSKTRYLGRLTVHVAGDTVSDYQYELIPTWVAEVREPDPRMVAQVEKYETEIDREYNVQIGTLLTDWQKSNKTESNLGNFLTDAMREICKTDFAVINSGGIRKSLRAGPITKLNIVEILPFSNYLVTFQCTGEQLLKLMETNAQSQVDHAHGILQVSGISYTYRVGPDGKVRIVNARINGKRIDPKATYTGATVDFVLYGQAEKYFGFEPRTSVQTGLIIADAIIDYISKHPRVESRVEGRMRRVN